MVDDIPLVCAGDLNHRVMSGTIRNRRIRLQNLSRALKWAGGAAASCISNSVG